MPSQSTQSPWKKYKRYSDNVKVEARLIEHRSPQYSAEEGRISECPAVKLMEVKESKTDEIKCPSCGHVLSQTGGKNVPNFRLDPKIFHARYKPIDTG